MRFWRRSWCKARATRDAGGGRICCMRGAQVLDMSAARLNVEHMSKMIQVRNVPDEMHRALKTRAAAEGMTPVRLHKAGAWRRRRPNRSCEEIARAEPEPGSVRSSARRRSWRSSARVAATDAGRRRLGPGRAISPTASTRGWREERLLRGRARPLGAASGRRRGRTCAAAGRSPRRARCRPGGRSPLAARRAAGAPDLTRGPRPPCLGLARQRQLLRRPLRGAGRDARRAAGHLRRSAWRGPGWRRGSRCWLSRRGSRRRAPGRGGSRA